ncbi:polysaccharide_lyase 8 family protein [Hexamita inflata]|uniref:Polysaccharide_lyase 8 family protein n=1 Tax=Hexamita inflata TaxID=28002 RepID=A0ABP1HRK1_9EUKA
MDRVIHRRENYAFAIAMHSNRVGDYESMDGENLHGWYTGDGMEYMYSNNQQQYTDFFPTVDPYLLQGTTELIVHRNDGEVDGAMNVQMSNATFVGGTDLNGTGVVGMEFYNYNYKLSGFRSWFMFEQSVMVIAQYNSSETYRSTFLNRQLENLNQSVFVDGVEINNEIKAYNCSKLFVEGTGHNDSVGYIFLKKTEIHLKKQVRTGDWNQIGTYSGATQRNYVTGYIEKTNDLQVQLWEVELLFLVYYVSNYILKYFATSNADDKFQYIISSWRLFMNYSLTQEGQKYDFDRIRPQSTIQSRYLIFQKGKIEITTCNKRTAMTKINAVEDVQGRSTNSLNKLRQF